ncbi:NAD(P)H-hydrate dehydratase [Pedobacter insulae]|uniref:Bifunctional NAD(P)H-hydrate repair enzyme n=1 Tax=Pedobacter insulae TaxID=414048 RepID=A0A1I2ZT56_9SPHI|nr:NAD(P)H-hydrate dehydratase [Pedobacter insulae]SFH40880.1 NAD(P)H-hydrate epimerase [Pedobacter insulae]
MKKLLSSSQMQEADSYTIKREAISSTALMERAAAAFVEVFSADFPDKEKSIAILCGQGNNGGDGLAIARLLNLAGYQHISVSLINFGTKQSEDYAHNLALLEQTDVAITPVLLPAALKGLTADLIIDAILGSGLHKPLTGKYAELASLLNDLNKPIVAVDVPTGFPGEGPVDQPYLGIKAELAITFQRPKINFFFPESAVALNSFKVVDIGLDEDFIARQESYWKLNDALTVKSRQNFTHKGTYGHALIVAGNTTTMGAALLAARGCLRVGAGLTTVCLPQSGLIALNTSLPEVMALPRSENLDLEAFEKYTSIAIGPGLGTAAASEEILANLLSLKKPLVLDADALTLLADRPDLFAAVPHQSMLTPHLKEFDRLFGDHQNWWARVETAKKQAFERQLIIVLKNQYTFICLPDGEIYINQTGNPGMASGGMGDVLTGTITGLLAQSYTAADAARLAVYIHGKAGDELAKNSFAISASQLADEIPKVMKGLTG